MYPYNRRVGNSAATNIPRASGMQVSEIPQRMKSQDIYSELSWIN